MRHVLIYCLLLLGAACRAPLPTPPKGATAVTAEPTSPVPPQALRKRVLDTPLWTQTLAILDTQVQLTAPDTVTENLVEPITEQIEAAFLATGRFELVERARVEVAHQEMSTTADALWYDQASVAKMGQGLGAMFIVLPSVRVNVGVFATRMDVLVKVMDTATGSIVQTFSARTTSTSTSTNASITTCLNRVKAVLAEAITPAYPAQAVIVHSPAQGIYWAEAKHVTMFHPGERVRFLRNEDVFNPVSGKVAPFTSEAGRGRIQSISPQGLVIESKVKAEPGWLIEVMP